MRREIGEEIRQVLRDSGLFAKVCGLDTVKPLYPLIRVWAHSSAGADRVDQNYNDPPPYLDLRYLLQIETELQKDEASGDSIDGPIYDLVDALYVLLHRARLLGEGIEPFTILDTPGMLGYEKEGPVIYMLTLSVRVVPKLFQLH